MASPPEQPWSNHERNYLLSEIIRVANPPPEVLMNIIRSLRIEPRWEDISLPFGRSLNASRLAYDTMQRTLQAQSLPVSMSPHTSMAIPPPTLKRAFAPIDASYSVSGREIRPKPLMAGPSYPQPSSSEPPTKKKRGRPTKAEQKAKADAAAISATTYEPGSSRPQVPPRMSSLMPRTMQPVGPSAIPEEAKPMLPPTTRMPIAAMLTPTVRETKSASNSSSSSGKKRRDRAAKSEQEETPTARSRSGGSPRELRVAPVPDDSPARAAILRHREDTTQRTSRSPRQRSPRQSSLEAAQQQQPQPPPHYYQPHQRQSPSSRQ